MARLQLLTKSSPEGREHNKAHKDKSTRKQPGLEESSQPASGAHLIKTPFLVASRESQHKDEHNLKTSTTSFSHMRRGRADTELLLASQPPPRKAPGQGGHPTPASTANPLWFEYSHCVRSSLWKGEEEEQVQPQACSAPVLGLKAQALWALWTITTITPQAGKEILPHCSKHLLAALKPWQHYPRPTRGSLFPSSK